MKKLIAFACALALACGVMAGCSSNPASSASSGAASESASAAADTAALADGTYDLKVETDSSMVNVVASELTVKDGVMTVTMSLNGEGFSRVYLGSANDAAEASDADIYDYYLNDEGKYTFDFPIEALDEDTDVALFGQRRDTWYDHVLVFSLADAS